MRKYEVVYIIDSGLGEDVVTALVEKFTTFFEKNAQIEKMEEWGKKRFAYPISKKFEGYYVHMDILATPEFPLELERQFKITEGILKYLVINKED